MWPFKKPAPDTDSRPKRHVMTRDQSATAARLFDQLHRAQQSGQGWASAHQDLWNYIDQEFPDRRPGSWSLIMKSVPVVMTWEPADEY